MVLQASGAPGGVLASVLGADGSGGDLLKLPAGGSVQPAIVLFVLLGLGLATQATTVQDRVQAAWTG